jgi:predicted pyridoxine 5'-phosphate oxidase superfamily flavin-nucleotide-binding protein
MIIWRLNMVAMPDEVIKMFDNPDCDKQKVLTWVSTVTEDGAPHLAPACFVKPVDNDKLLIGISFMSKTASNVKNGSRVAVGNAVYPNGYMVKGRGEIMETGKHFEDFKERINKRFGGKIKPKAVLLVSVEEAYHLKPAEGRKKIA